MPESGRRPEGEPDRVRPAIPQLDLGLLRNLQGVIDLDPKVSNGALQLGMAEQQLDGP
jgi:hypothetical protein